MPGKYDSFKKAILNSLTKIDAPFFGDIYRVFKTEVARLCEEGLVAFENDYTLSGFGLECRVKNLFKELNFEIQSGRDGFEDFIVKPPNGFEPSKPIVLEVKSSRRPNISRDQLRQLDDWVFELSGEQEARKHGLKGVGGIDPLAIVSSGMLTRKSKPQHHPTPHKGVFVFNGPIGEPFEKRKSKCLSPNDEDFVDKRDFCVIPFDVLIDWLAKCKKDPEIKHGFWNKVHTTSGLLS